MRFQIVNPTKALVLDATYKELEDLKNDLTYTNTAAQQDVKRHYGNVWLRRKDEEAWQQKLDLLKSKVKNTLVFEENGETYIRPGSISYLPPYDVENLIKYPVPKKIAWKHVLPFQLHEYQEISVVELLRVRHGNVALCTSAGKTAIILKACRETGFRTAIIAPSKSIFNELLAKFEYHFGKGEVGTFGDGKKKIGKRFTICIADSLTNLTPGTEEWNFFSNLDMLIADESHTWGAETLDAVCHEALANIPYRLFMSATQTRGDGTLKLLQSTIGQTVHTLTIEQAIKGGFICDNEVRIIEVESSNPNENSADPLEMKRIHFLSNKNICAIIAKLANAKAVADGTQTLVLVEELSQIARLLLLLKVPFAYAHSEKNAKKLEALGLEKVDPAESVEKFNKNEVKVLIGTSCIATGTNIYPTHFTFNWVGGSSEIRTKQGAIGRSSRLHSQNPHKEKCVPKEFSTILDFDVRDIDILGRHLNDRISYYEESGKPVKRIKINATQTKAGRV